MAVPGQLPHCTGCQGVGPRHLRCICGFSGACIALHQQHLITYYCSEPRGWSGVWRHRNPQRCTEGRHPACALRLRPRLLGVQPREAARGGISLPPQRQFRLPPCVSEVLSLLVCCDAGLATMRLLASRSRGRQAPVLPDTPRQFKRACLFVFRHINPPWQSGRAPQQPAPAAAATATVGQPHSDAAALWRPPGAGAGRRACAQEGGSGAEPGGRSCCCGCRGSADGPRCRAAPACRCRRCQPPASAAEAHERRCGGHHRHPRCWRQRRRQGCGGSVGGV